MLVNDSHKPKQSQALWSWTGSLIGLGMSLLGNAVVFAECGDYVTIGNKSKLAELREAGFDTGETMKGHPAEDHREDQDEDHPAVPCSGLHCGAAPMTSPQHQPASLLVLPSKQGFMREVTWVLDLVSQFEGFRSFSEKGSHRKISWDRPPE